MSATLDERVLDALRSAADEDARAEPGYRFEGWRGTYYVVAKSGELYGEVLAALRRLSEAGQVQRRIVAGAWAWRAR